MTPTEGMKMEWISVEKNLPDGPGGIAMVRLPDGKEVKVYYHRDKMVWLHRYNEFPWTHWQDFHTLEWLDNVTHWMPLPMSPRKQNGK